MCVQRSRPGITAQVHSRHSPRLNDTPSAGDKNMTSAWCAEDGEKDARTLRRGGRARQHRLMRLLTVRSLFTVTDRLELTRHATHAAWARTHLLVAPPTMPRTKAAQAQKAQKARRLCASVAFLGQKGRNAICDTGGGRCGASECHECDGAGLTAQTRTAHQLLILGLPFGRHHSAAHSSAGLPRAPTFAALRLRS